MNLDIVFMFIVGRNKNVASHILTQKRTENTQRSADRKYGSHACYSGVQVL